VLSRCVARLIDQDRPTELGRIGDVEDASINQVAAYQVLHLFQEHVKCEEISFGVLNGRCMSLLERTLSKFDSREGLRKVRTALDARSPTSQEYPFARLLFLIVCRRGIQLQTTDQKIRAAIPRNSSYQRARPLSHWHHVQTWRVRPVA
jgi:hypothetical protein